jgi:hypothetical protein
MQLSPTTCNFIPLRSKYSPKHPVLKHPQFMLTAGNDVYILYMVKIADVRPVSWIHDISKPICVPNDELFY